MSGNRVTFTMVSNDGDRTATFAGTISGDRIAFTRTGITTRPGGDPGRGWIVSESGPSKFVVTRVK